MIVENGKIVTLPIKQIAVAPEFTNSQHESNPHGESNHHNLSSSQNLMFCQETLTKKRPLRTDISFSYCGELINKPVNNSDKAKTNFHSMSGNVDNIIAIFLKGFAVSPFHYTNNHRNSENATLAGLLIVDIDNQGWIEQEIIDDNNNRQVVKQKVYQHQLTLEEYQAIDFCRQYTFAITTASHTETWHRFRVFMPLPMDIDKTTYEVALRHLNGILKGAIDTNATNPSIGFYGNSNGILYKSDDFQALDYNWLSQLQPEVDKIKSQLEKQKRKLAQKIAKNQKKLAKSTTDKNIIEALSYVSSEDYNTWTKVGFALHHNFNGSDEGLEIFDNWSSQAHNYSGRNAIEYKWLSFSKSPTDKPITIATVFRWAMDGGYQPSGKNHSESEFSVSYYSLEQFRKDLDNQEWSEFQLDLIRSTNNLSKSFIKGFGDGKKKLSIPELQPATFTYYPERPLPSRADYDRKTEPLIIIPTKYKNQRPKIIKQLIKLGWKHIFDNSQTGGGKSYDVAQMKEVIYLDVNYNNVSNKEIANFPTMIPRTYYGIYQTPEGKIKVDPSIKVREDNKNEVIAPQNCHLKPLFSILEDKGYQAENESLPCQKCQHRNYCGSVDYLFKGARKKAVKAMIASNQGKMHPSQLTLELLNNSFSDFTLVWEEAGNYAAIKDIAFSHNDLCNAITQLTQINNDLISNENRNLLINVLYKLTELLPYKNAKNLVDTHKYYGLDFQTIINNLPPLPHLTAEELKSLFDYFQPNLDDIIPDLSNPIGGDVDNSLKNKFKQAEKIKRNEMKEEMLENMSKISPNFYLLFEALFNNSTNSNTDTFNNDHSQTTLSISTQENLIVSRFDNHYRELANQELANLYLDATATNAQIKGFYGINDLVISIKTENVALNNVKVFNLNTKGLKSKDWSATAINRSKKLIQMIETQNPHKKIAVMTVKKYAEELNTPFWYGLHDRGTNELMDYDIIIFVGTPNVNLGDAQREYHLIYGNNANFTFEQYYTQLLMENRWQGTGRHRGQWQLEKELHQYYICTDEDLSYFSQLGMEVSTIDAEIVNPECGSRGDVTFFNLKKNAVAILGAGKKLTQNVLAEAVKMTRDGVSHHMRGFEGGWKTFKKCVVSLIESFKGNLHKINSEDDYFTQGWKDNPHEVISLAIDLIRENGFVGYLEFVKHYQTTLDTALEILWTLASLWDERLSSIFPVTN